ncbi:MAG TPA: TetR/AcrR family transcriptional regulator [Candidatus Dormibacteraeota bacterium]|nr:TetR/AcrR family transcriptional regulator [Candidatus Dormibacteraeota bacterium]
MPRAKQRTPELRDRVLRVAVATLASEGVSGFTTRRVAREAATSTPAVYELFGDKAGLVREIFFAGFRLLRQRFDRLGETADPRADLVAVIHALRKFVGANPLLAEVMFSRPFVDFDPSPSGVEAGSAVRLFVIGRVRRCIDAGILAGDATDIAHVLVSLTQGLAATEIAGWLGTSRASIERRWTVAIHAVLDGLRPAPSR